MPTLADEVAISAFGCFPEDPSFAEIYPWLGFRLGTIGNVEEVGVGAGSPAGRPAPIVLCLVGVLDLGEEVSLRRP